MKYYAVERSTSLSHHGILGQKWGVRRYQNKDGSLTSVGKARYGSSTASATSVSDFYKNRDHKTEDKVVNKTSASLAAKVALGVVTMNPFLIADAVNQGIGAASAAGKVAKVDKMLAANTNVDPKSGLKVKKSEMTEKEDLKMVNPAFKNLQDNSKSNCMLCTTTYDLRRRGYDVTAGKASVGYNNADLKRWYPNVEPKSVNFEHTPTEVFTHKNLIEATTNALVSQGDGARGNLMVRWASGGLAGHSMAYEVSNGSVKILDGQANKIYSNPASILRRCSSAEYARLDNVEPDWKEIKECLKTA